jgi:hypothetical protein
MARRHNASEEGTGAKRVYRERYGLDNCGSGHLNTTNSDRVNKSAAGLPTSY